MPTKKPYPVSDQRLREMYNRDRFSQSEIGKMISRSQPSVCQKLKSLRIPIRTRSEAARLLFQQGKGNRNLPYNCSTDQLHQWRTTHPDEWDLIRQRGARISAYRRGKNVSWVNCSWCAQKVRRWPSLVKRSRFSACSISHARLAGNWMRYHPDEPRPLLLARLREMAGDERNPDRLRRMAEEIGAGDIEVAEILFPTEAR